MINTYRWVKRKKNFAFHLGLSRPNAKLFERICYLLVVNISALEIGTFHFKFALDSYIGDLINYNLQDNQCNCFSSNNCTLWIIGGFPRIQLWCIRQVWLRFFVLNSAPSSIARGEKIIPSTHVRTFQLPTLTLYKRTICVTHWQRHIHQRALGLNTLCT